MFNLKGKLILIAILIICTSATTVSYCLENECIASITYYNDANCTLRLGSVKTEKLKKGTCYVSFFFYKFFFLNQTNKE